MVPPSSLPSTAVSRQRRKQRERPGAEDARASRKKSRIQPGNAPQPLGSPSQDGSDQRVGEPGTSANGSDWSRSKKKRMRAMKAKMKKQQMTDQGLGNPEKEATTGSVRTPRQTVTEPTDPVPARIASAGHDTHLTSVSDQPRISATLSKYQARLQGSRFRILNEQLYTMNSQDAFQQFSSQPHLFEEYHDGFASQVEHWPVQPVVVVANELKRLVDTIRTSHRDSNTSQQLSKRRLPIVVADFGCGKAELAKELLQVQLPGEQACPFQVHSFDLVATCDLVTACDMSNTPLADGSVDVAVFCLSLMGNNLADFIREAHRVLTPTGTVKIVEVRSRFEGSTQQGDDTKTTRHHRKGKGRKKGTQRDAEKPVSEMKRFMNALDGLGFECVHLDRSNKMFFVLELRKNGRVPNAKLEFTAKPCIYKRR